jgi:hypothetical protein
MVARRAAIQQGSVSANVLQGYPTDSIAMLAQFQFCSQISLVLITT